MEKFIEICNQYGTLILFCLSLVLDIILILVKKRPQLIDNSLFQELSLLVLEAEKKFPESKQGVNKLHYVLDSYFTAHPEKLDFSDSIIKVVEYILSLPKKGATK